MEALLRILEKNARMPIEDIAAMLDKTPEEIAAMMDEAAAKGYIRGYETLEAESVVDNYIDSAVMAKLGSVTIIHGKGTGALRKAVHEILRRNKAVKSFRLGRYGEGEAGVTIVELK